MTIYYGCDGSLNLYYKGLLISSFPLTKKKTFERYKYQGQYLILTSMRQNLNIKKIIYTLTFFCTHIYKRKKNKLPIRRSDHKLFLSSLFALLKLKVIEDDELNGYLVMPKKKTI
jgi:hypothetical protein